MIFDVTVTPAGVIDYKLLYGDPGHAFLVGTSPASGSFSTSFSYPADDTYVATLIILSPASCTGNSIQVDVEVEACGPDECPVSSVELVVEDANGTNVTTQLHEDGCLPSGQYVVRAVVEPPGATSDFSWSVGGVAAAVGQRGVVAINGRQLTIDLTLFRSVSVIAAGCASDGIDLRPCDRPLCANLTGITIQSGCGPGTVSFIANVDLPNEVEAYNWDFDDGTQTTGQQAIQHTYTTAGRSDGSAFKASVVVRRHAGCEPRETLPASVDVPKCVPPKEDDDGVCDLCCIWFIVNLTAVFATLVAFVVAGCVFQWLDPISISTAVGLAIAVTISILVWAVVCRGRSGGSCRPILRWIDILDFLTILAGVLALLTGVVSPCAIAFWVNVGFLQWVRRILQTIAVFTGCLPNPWFR
jgi:hypothetical protein